MGYHSRKIQKGEYGHASKIQEEFEEFMDAHDHSNPVMELVELTDLIGAIEAYALNHYDIELNDLIRMTRATQSAFKDGTRKSGNPCGEVPLSGWRCLRCKQVVDYEKFRCGCSISPAPWEPFGQQHE